MILLQKLKINSDKAIDIIMPPAKDKFNTYCKPTKDLHKFDEIFAIFKEKNKEIIIISEIANLIIEHTKQTFTKALNEELILPDNIDIGGFGYRYNVAIYNEKDEWLDFVRFVLWSGGFTRSNLSTFIYNKDKKFYLEIAPIYPWIWDEPSEDSNHITFDEFMKTYKPIAVEEIDYATIQKWIEQCNETLNAMIRVQPNNES